MATEYQLQYHEVLEPNSPTPPVACRQVGLVPPRCHCSLHSGAQALGLGCPSSAPGILMFSFICVATYFVLSLEYKFLHKGVQLTLFLSALEAVFRVVSEPLT